MSWSYSGDPATSPLDKQRFLVGDTNSAKPIFSDEEIKSEISQAPAASVYTIAARLCEQAAVHFSNEVDKKTDSVSVFASQRSKQYQQRALYYRGKIPAQPYAGGVSKDDKQRNRDNNDLELPYITTDSNEFSVAEQAKQATQGAFR